MNDNEECYGLIEFYVDSESKFEFPKVKKKSGPYRKGIKRNHLINESMSVHQIILSEFNLIGS